MMNDLYNLIALKANEKFVHFNLYCHAVQKGKEKPGIMVHKLLYNDNIHRQHYCRCPVLVSSLHHYCSHMKNFGIHSLLPHFKFD